jgi:excisionase family DNA binding protein
MSDMLTVDEAAAELKMHPVTIRKLLRGGDLPGVKVGPRQWRIRKADLTSYIDNKLNDRKPAAAKAE